MQRSTEPGNLIGGEYIDKISQNSIRQLVDKFENLTHSWIQQQSKYSVWVHMIVIDTENQQYDWSREHASDDLSTARKNEEESYQHDLRSTTSIMRWYRDSHPKMLNYVESLLRSEINAWEWNSGTHPSILLLHGYRAGIYFADSGVDLPDYQSLVDGASADRVTRALKSWYEEFEPRYVHNAQQIPLDRELWQSDFYAYHPLLIHAFYAGYTTCGDIAPAHHVIALYHALREQFPLGLARHEAYDLELAGDRYQLCFSSGIRVHQELYICRPGIANPTKVVVLCPEGWAFELAEGTLYGLILDDQKLSVADEIDPFRPGREEQLAASIASQLELPRVIDVEPLNNAESQDSEAQSPEICFEPRLDQSDAEIKKAWSAWVKRYLPDAGLYREIPAHLSDRIFQDHAMFSSDRQSDLPNEVLLVHGIRAGRALATEESTRRTSYAWLSMSPFEVTSALCDWYTQQRPACAAHFRELVIRSSIGHRSQEPLLSYSQRAFRAGVAATIGGRSGLSRYGPQGNRELYKHLMQECQGRITRDDKQRIRLGRGRYVLETSPGLRGHLVIRIYRAGEELIQRCFVLTSTGHLFREGQLTSPAKEEKRDIQELLTRDTDLTIYSDQDLADRVRRHFKKSL